MLKRLTPSLLLFFGLLVCFESQAFGQSGTKATRQAAWVLGDKLSLAAFVHVEDVPAASVKKVFDEAKVQANALNVTIPNLPAKTADKTENRATVLDYLLNEAGKTLASSLKASFGQDHATLYELSLKSNILLIMYGPGESTTKSLANVIRTRSERLGLPPHLTANLLSLIDAGADYSKVKPAILQMHRDVANYLGQ